MITVLALAFYATPLFWVGLMLVLLFSVWLDWLPSFGMSTIGADFTARRCGRDVAQHLVLPALTLGLFYHGGLCAADPRLDAGGGSTRIS